MLGDKSAVVAQEKKAIADAYGNKFIIPLDFEMLDSAHPITKRDLEADYVMKLPSTITTELSIHRKPMPHIKLQTYPENMRSLVNLPLQDLSGLNTKVWFCIMTEFSYIEKLWLISQIQCGTGHLIHLVKH